MVSETIPQLLYERLSQPPSEIAPQPPNETISQPPHDPKLQHTNQTHSASTQQTHPPQRPSARTLRRIKCHIEGEQFGSHDWLFLKILNLQDVFLI